MEGRPLRHIDRIYLARWAHRKFKSMRRHKRRTTRLARCELYAGTLINVRSLEFSLWARQKWSRMRVESLTSGSAARGGELRRATYLVVGFQSRGRRPALSGDEMRERLREFSLIIASGEDPPDRVWPLRSGQSRGAGFGSRSLYSRSIATRCWKARCGSGYERLSGRCAENWASRSYPAFCRENMSISSP